MGRRGRANLFMITQGEEKPSLRKGKKIFFESLRHVRNLSRDSEKENARDCTLGKRRNLLGQGGWEEEVL